MRWQVDSLRCEFQRCCDGVWGVNVFAEDDAAFSSSRSNSMAVISAVVWCNEAGACEEQTP